MAKDSGRKTRRCLGEREREKERRAAATKHATPPHSCAPAAARLSLPSSVSSGDLREGARYWGVGVGEKRVMEERERRTNATPATREPEGGGKKEREGGRERMWFRV